jgi:hypothetical protein
VSESQEETGPPAAVGGAMAGGALARWLTPTSQSRIERIGCDQIDERPWPGGRVEDDSLVALRRSVAERGLIEPLLLRPSGGGRLRVVLGARRLLVARALGLSTVPAIVRELTDSEAALLAAWSVLPSRSEHTVTEIAAHLGAAGVADGEIAVLLAATHTDVAMRPRVNPPTTFAAATPLHFATLTTPVGRLLDAVGSARPVALAALNRTDTRHLELLAS